MGAVAGVFAFMPVVILTFMPLRVVMMFAMGLAMFTAMEVVMAMLDKDSTPVISMALCFKEWPECDGDCEGGPGCSCLITLDFGPPS